MDSLNFQDLMRRVGVVADLNAQELLLYEARSICEQTILSVANTYLMQIDSALVLINKKRELLVSALPPEDEMRQKSNHLKVSVCLVFELLRLVGKGRDVNDLTTLSWFVSIITGYSRKSILNAMQKGVTFSKRYHGAAIQEVNEVLGRLDLPFALDLARRY